MSSSTYFDKQDQYDKIMSIKIPGEFVSHVFDCKGTGTGFIALTDRRIIVQDDSFVGGKSSVVSIPFSKVITVAYVSDKSIFGSFVASSSIAIQTSGKLFTATFRGDDKARLAHDIILNYVLNHG